MSECSTFSNLSSDALSALKRDGIRVYGFDNKSLYEFTSLRDVYESCIYVRTIIDTFADCVRNVNFRLYKTAKEAEDKELFEHPVLSLVRNPNPLQTGGDWMAQRLIYQKLYGKSFIRGVQGRTLYFKDSKALWNLPPDSVRIVEYNNGINDIYSRFTLDEIIDYFEFRAKDGLKTLQPEEVLAWIDFHFDLTAGKSEIQTLIDSASNLMAIQESRGQIIKHRGMIGFLSPEMSQDAAGSIIAMKDPEVKAGILSAIKRLYGTLRRQASIAQVDVPMKWTPVAIDIEKLRLDEQEKAEFNKCCDLLGVPREIFDGQSTYDNQVEAKKKLYTDRVIPWVENEISLLSAKMELEKDGLRLEGDFSHLEVLQDDELAREDTEMKKTERLLKLKDAGQISGQTVNKELGYDVAEVADPMKQKQVNKDEDEQE